MLLGFITKATWLMTKFIEQEGYILYLPLECSQRIATRTNKQDNLTNIRIPRTKTNSTVVVLGGALRYDCFNPEFNGASGDKTGVESFVVPTYSGTKESKINNHTKIKNSNQANFEIIRDVTR